MLLDFILYYKATVIKNSMELVKKQTLRSMEQNRAPRNKLILRDSHDRGGKNMQ